MTADYIAFHADERPEAVALVNRGRAITFATFNRDLRKFSQAVSVLGVAKGGSVAVGCDDLYIHWLLVLAFERFGVVTASFNSLERDGAAPLLSSVDLVLSEPHFSTAGARRHHGVTQEWLARVFAIDAEQEQPLPPQAPDDPVRILRTSGTTGMAKQIRNSRLAYDAKIARWIILTGINRHSRLLISIPLSVQGMYSCASACLRMGGTLISAATTEARDIARAIHEHDVTALILLPVQVKRVLDTLPDGFAKPRTLTLCCFGAALSASLREAALAVLATEVVDMYGSNETGFISSIASSRDEGIGTVWPDARVQVVDEHDQPLPYGQIGRIRARTPEMIEEYPGDPGTTGRMFKDRWFYPGDLGILHGSRRLEVIGRGDDLLNLGGRKFSPEAIERAIIKSGIVGDLGVCALPNAEGIQELLIAITDSEGEARDLLGRLTAVLGPLRIGAFRAVRLPAIPRNANGKIQRDLLRSAIVEAMHGARPVTL